MAQVPEGLKEPLSPEVQKALDVFEDVQNDFTILYVCLQAAVESVDVNLCHNLIVGADQILHRLDELIKTVLVSFERIAPIARSARVLEFKYLIKPLL
jgi:hypothetical protein